MSCTSCRFKVKPRISGSPFSAGTAFWEFIYVAYICQLKMPKQTQVLLLNWQTEEKSKNFKWLYLTTPIFRVLIGFPVSVTISIYFWILITFVLLCFNSWRLEKFFDTIISNTRNHNRMLVLIFCLGTEPASLERSIIPLVNQGSHHPPVEFYIPFFRQKKLKVSIPFFLIIGWVIIRN